MAGTSKNRNSLFSPGQLITGFIFSNILFLILGIAIGKGDFSTLPESTMEKPLPEVVVPKSEPDEQIAEFRSLELTSEDNQKKHIELPTRQTEPRRTEPGPVPRKELVSPPQQAKKKEPVKAPKKQPARATSKPENRPVYYLQLTASKQKAPIQRFYNRVKKKGYPAKMVHEGSYYKVQLGNYSSKEKAIRMKADIDKALGTKSWIKQR
jgi:cell division septation protein DedD